MALKTELEKQGVWLFTYRSYLPIVILLAGLLVYVKSMYYFDYYFLNNLLFLKLYFYFCVAVSLLGLVIRIFTVGYTPKNTSGRNTKGQVADTVNTSGIYSLLRHPLYLGNFFMWLGPTLFVANIWFIITICLLFWVYYERIMFAEESFLIRKFGDRYTDWSSRVPAFIPSFKNFEKPNLNFSWKKVVKKEKNGLVAVFVIFSMFDLIGKELTKNEFDYIFHYFTLFFIVLYFILKVLKRKTNIFEEEDR
jgi:protein-S-isoprenylcysteine O-methyltransferase Ste14